MTDMHPADRLVGRAARALTRRRLLRNAGAGALSFSLGVAFLGERRASPVLAHGSSSHPCGPSPYCPSARCFDGQCSNAAGRVYSTYTCRPRALGGCWPEDYRSVGRGMWRCCDCCALDGGGNRCGSCGDRHTRYACICRKRTG
jgi:hypothetical protein